MDSLASVRNIFAASLVLVAAIAPHTADAAEYLKNDVGFFQPVISIEQANRKVQDSSERRAHDLGVLISEAGDSIGRKTILEKEESRDKEPAASSQTPGNRGSAEPAPPSSAESSVS